MLWNMKSSWIMHRIMVVVCFVVACSLHLFAIMSIYAALQSVNDDNTWLHNI
jgi:hypothetical protein